jgi:hypothetical protein
MNNIDLMLDCKFRDEDEDCDTFHIIRFEHNLFQVVHNSRVCNALNWDEMIGQISVLTKPDGWNGYPMETRERVFAERKRHEDRMKENQE